MLFLSNVGWAPASAAESFALESAPGDPPSIPGLPPSEVVIVVDELQPIEQTPTRSENLLTDFSESMRMFFLLMEWRQTQVLGRPPAEPFLHQ
jgi:hypothetical protein